jgi:hypothetical protein
MQSRYSLSSGHQVVVDWREAPSVGRVWLESVRWVSTARADGTLIGRSGVPPLVVAARRGDGRTAVLQPAFRGLNADIAWRVVASPFGAFVWHQSYRDGLEQVDDLDDRAALTVAVEVDYGALVRLLYLGDLFESVLGPSRVLAAYSTFSFLSGLLQDGSSLRLGVVAEEHARTIARWSMEACHNP